MRFDTINTANASGRLDQLVAHRSPLVRCDAASYMAEHVDDENHILLLQLLSDRNVLVRVEAADSLSEYPCRKTFDALAAVLNAEKYYLLKGFAALSLGRVGVEVDAVSAQRLLTEALEGEKRIFVKLCCYESLYLLGCANMLERIISLYGSSSYRNRCAVIESLGELLDRSNSERIREFLLSELPSETALSVKDKMTDLLKQT